MVTHSSDLRGEELTLLSNEHSSWEDPEQFASKPYNISGVSTIVCDKSIMAKASQLYLLEDGRDRIRFVCHFCLLGSWLLDLCLTSLMTKLITVQFKAHTYCKKKRGSY